MTQLPNPKSLIVDWLKRHARYYVGWPARRFWRWLRRRCTACGGPRLQVKGGHYAYKRWCHTCNKRAFFGIIYGMSQKKFSELFETKESA